MARRGKRQTIKASLEIKKFMVGKAGLAAYIPAYKARCEDFGPIWDMTRAIVFLQVGEVFENEGEVEGFGRWDTEGPAEYKEWKTKHFPSKKILELTGRLRAQLTGKSGDHFEERSKRHITIGSNYPVKGSSGQRSAWWTTDVGDNVLPFGGRWSMNPDSEDIGGIHAEGQSAGISAIMTSRGEVPAPNERTQFRMTDEYIAAIADLAVDHATDTQVS